MTEGKKFDENKNRLELLPPEFVEAISQILTFGANKYGSYNWMKGIKYSRVVGALLRHIYAFLKGEKLDPESGMPHLWHAGCNLAFLIYFETYPDSYSDLNNLWAYNGNPDI